MRSQYTYILTSPGQWPSWKRVVGPRGGKFLMRDRMYLAWEPVPVPVPVPYQTVP